jgi:hypothetical protein
VPLAHRSRPIVAFASLCAAIATCWAHDVRAFEKQTCATAYENAQQLRNQLKLRRAREQLLVCGHSSCPSVVTTDCNKWLTQVDAALASVVLRARDERGELLTDVRVTMDGELLREKIDGAAVMVDPGLHLFRFESGTYPPVEQRQMLPKGDRNRQVEVQLIPRQQESTTRAEPNEVSKDEPKPAPRPEPAAGASGPGAGVYVLGGIGLVALSSFAYFGLSGNSDASNLRASGCAPYCPKDEVNAARSKLIAANVSLGVGIAALGTAVILWAVQDSSPPKSDHAPAKSKPGFAGVDLIVAPGATGAELVTTFTAP